MSDRENALMIVKKDDIYKEVTSNYFSKENKDINQTWIWRILSSILPSKQFETFEILINTAYNLGIVNKKNPNDKCSSHLVLKTFNKMLNLKEITDLPNNAAKKFKSSLEHLGTFHKSHELLKILFLIKENSPLSTGEKNNEWLCKTVAK